MRKLIDLQTTNEAAITCDNKDCNFEIPASTIKDYNPQNPINSIIPFINVACPKCGENLLTEHDFNLALRFYVTVRWLNRWFSWLTIFFKEKGSVEKRVSFHKEIKID